ncbi:MAG: hypothetical protein JWO63_2439 [Frankiales bacterium]|jgi:hypothetical protein|nr:hypothetical protein [Frankiales bacterium]
MTESSDTDNSEVVILGGGRDSPEAEASDDGDLTAQIEQPAKVMRIGTMIKQLLEEVRAAPLDEAGRQRLKEIHQSSIRELETGLSPDLRAELDRLSLPFDEERVPSEPELRVAQAQLVGWLEGLFHGIQTALFAQQMAARAQLEQMRGRALPGQVGPAGPGAGGLFGPGMGSGEQGAPGEHGTGQYL